MVCTNPFIRTSVKEKRHDIWYVECKEPVEDRVTYDSCKRISEV